MEVYKEINKQYYQDDLNPNNFWESIRNKLQNYFSNTYLYTSNFTEDINTILYKLDYLWYKFKEKSYTIESNECCKCLSNDNNNKKSYSYIN